MSPESSDGQVFTRGPLEGLRVIDLSHGTAGPRAAGMLADYGADVILVERPGGDPYRDELAIPYASFHRGKRSVTVEMPGQTEVLHKLLASADVVIQSWRPGVAERLGLGYDELHRRHPHLIVTSITGFGSFGPHTDLPGHEALVQAVVGVMAEQRGLREPPIYEGLPFASIGAAYLACIGTLGAIYRRTSDGIGRHVETSLVDGALTFLSMTWGDSDDPSTVPRHTPGARRLIARSFECADGEYLGVHTAAVGAFGRLMVVLGMDDRIPPDPNGADMMLPLDEDQRRLVNDELPGIFRAQPRSYWVERLLEADICVVPEMRPTEVFDEPQARHNRMVLRLDDAALGPIDVPAPPARFSSHDDPRPTPAPLPGADTDAVLTETLPPVAFSPADAPTDNALLAGLKVLDVGAYFAGPYSSRLLSDLGADVIKLETTLGDQQRGLLRTFNAAQAGKRAVSFNLKDPDLQPALRGLIEWADVVHHNMRPGAAERLGVGYEQVHEINPRAVYLYAPGWGSSGPNAHRQSFAPMLSGHCGTGYEVAGQFNPPMWPLGNEDPGNGLVGAIAALIALIERQRTGQGQYVENPQLNAAMVHLQHIARGADGTVLGAGQLDPLQTGVGPLDRLYQTSDGWIAVVAKSASEITALTAVTGIDILDDQRFATPLARKENEYELGSMLDEVLIAKSSSDWITALTAAGVGAVEPVSGDVVAQFHRDPENQRSGQIAEISLPDGRTLRLISRLIRVSHCAPVEQRPSPALGEHTDTVLRSLGYDDAKIAELRGREAIR